MTIFKWIKNGNLYFIYRGGERVIAIPFEHSGESIVNPNLDEFIPVKAGPGSTNFI